MWVQVWLTCGGKRCEGRCAFDSCPLQTVLTLPFSPAPSKHPAPLADHHFFI